MEGTRVELGVEVAATPEARLTRTYRVALDGEDGYLGVRVGGGDRIQHRLPRADWTAAVEAPPDADGEWYLVDVAGVSGMLEFRVEVTP